MYYWKLDDETIRCLITKEEIVQMGFRLEDLRRDQGDMEHFLEEIIQNSRQYINWNTENGMQTYSARELPSEQLLITISCTFTDVAIDRDLDQIRRMTRAFRDRVPPERIDEIYSLKGKEKEEAFEELTNDLHDLYMGNYGQDDEEGEIHEESGSVITQEDSRSFVPPQVLAFGSFELLQEFCRFIKVTIVKRSTLYKTADSYYLIIEFREDSLMEDVNIFLNTAQEYGGILNVLKNEDAFLSEHARLVVEDHAITMLTALNR